MNDTALFAQELETYYGSPPLDFGPWEQELHQLRERHPGDSEFRHKARGYAFMAERCPVHVFRHGPFFFELNTGRDRTDLGTGGLGGWLKRSPFGTALTVKALSVNGTNYARAGLYTTNNWNGYTPIPVNVAGAGAIAIKPGGTVIRFQ